MTLSLSQENALGHHWKLESPMGQTSRGVCQLCGTEWEFYNAIQYDNWRKSRRKWGKGTKGETGYDSVCRGRAVDRDATEPNMVSGTRKG